MLKCQSCGGTFEPTLPDGLQYFHACPPLAAHEIRARLDNATLTLSRADQQRLDDAIAEDQRAPVERDSPTREQRVLGELVIERPNKRDENVRPGAADKSPAARIKAAGAGVVAVPPP